MESRKEVIEVIEVVGISKYWKSVETLKMRCDVAITALLASGATAAAVKKGFVTTKGTTFKLDGKDFHFAGSNAYYFPFNDVSISREAYYQLSLTIVSSLPTSRRVSLLGKRLA